MWDSCSVTPGGRAAEEPASSHRANSYSDTTKIPTFFILEATRYVPDSQCGIAIAAGLSTLLGCILTALFGFVLTAGI